MAYGLLVVEQLESPVGEEEYLLRGEPESEEMVEEEIVQLIGADKVFCLLLYLAVLVGRNQLGRDRRVDYIHQRLPCLLAHLIVCDILYEMPYQSLRYRYVHTVHGHMVAVVCRPS